MSVQPCTPSTQPLRRACLRRLAPVALAGTLLVAAAGVAPVFAGHLAQADQPAFAQQAAPTQQPALAVAAGPGDPAADSAPAQPAAVPLALEDLVYAVEEEAGTRIVTPYYSVLVPVEHVGEGFAFSYIERHEPLGEAAGLFVSHVLSVTLERGSDYSVGFEVLCYDPAVSGGRFGYVDAFAQTQSSDGLSIVVTTYPVGFDANRWEVAQDNANLYATFVEPAVDAGAQKWARQAKVALTELDGGATLVETPWYTFELPAHLVAGEGFGLSYVDGLPAECLDLGELWPVGSPAAHTLYVITQSNGDRFETEHFELRCVSKDFDPADAPSYAVAQTGVWTADGLQVCVFVPVQGAGSEQARAELFELAQQYASQVGAAETAPASELQAVDDPANPDFTGIQGNGYVARNVGASQADPSLKVVVTTGCALLGEAGGRPGAEEAEALLDAYAPLVTVVG